jgi:SNF2 family DNA or RNA helicase
MELLPHQPAAVQFLAQRQRAFLADDPGLGKTCTAIVAADRIMAMRILVIVPAVARINWGREVHRWQRLGRKIVVALTYSDIQAALDAPAVVLIVSYDLARSERELLWMRAWDLLILDEAHMLKNPEAKRTRAIYGRTCRRETPSIAATAKRVWCLSGSPILAGQHEFFTHATALWTYGGPGWPLTYGQWMARYTEGFDSVYGYRVTGSRNSFELQDAVDEFILQRRADDVMPLLPALVVGEAAIPLAQADRLKLEELLLEVPELPAFLRAAADDDGTARADEHVARARRLLAFAKLPGTVDLLTQELDGGVEKVIVFGHHREPLQRLHKALEAYGPALVQGGMTPALVQNAVDRFQNDSSCRVFIGNIQAAGTAITLTAAHHVRFLEADWTPEANRQAMMRARRIGQKRSVFATFLVADHPLDEALAATLARKTRLIRDFETEGANP